MKKLFKKFLQVLAVGFIAVGLVACGGKKDKESTADKDHLDVVSSFTILTDMVESIGGDYVKVHNVIPIGTDPHEYEPLPEDIKATTDADVIFAFGMNLEGGEKGWLGKLVKSVDKDYDKDVVIASDGIEPKYLHEEGERAVNPHAFISPKAGITIAKNITKTLKEKLPKHAKAIEKQSKEYIAELEKIDKAYEEKIGAIPEEDRIFVASERAFQYMADAYGLKEGYIWQIDTEENGSPEQIKQAIAFVNDNHPRVLFVESNVDRRPMETVSKETGVEIFDRPIMSDEIGKKGEPGDTYVKYLENNLEIIVDGLTE